MPMSDELKQEIVAAYEEAEPTPETTGQIVKDISDDQDLSPNAVRRVLSNAGVYVKQQAKAASASKASGDKPKRKGKEEQQADLIAAVEECGLEADKSIVEKMTGKAAAHFAELFGKLKQ